MNMTHAQRNGNAFHLLKQVDYVNRVNTERSKQRGKYYADECDVAMSKYHATWKWCQMSATDGSTSWNGSRSRHSRLTETSSKLVFISDSESVTLECIKCIQCHRLIKPAVHNSQKLSCITKQHGWISLFMCQMYKIHRQKSLAASCMSVAETEWLRTSQQAYKWDWHLPTLSTPSLLHLLLADSSSI